MKLHDPLYTRRSGVLLHPTSLPGPWYQGDFSHNAFRFVEFLAAAGQTVWQVLPLGPTHSDGSPYQCLSTHAGNPLLISLDWMVDRGWLEPGIWAGCAQTPQWRLEVLERGCINALADLDEAVRADFDQFVLGQAFWLDDYANYIVLKKIHQGASWIDWPSPLRRHNEEAIKKALAGSETELTLRKFEQYLFFTQWRELRNYAHQHGVYIFGDLPIFVSGDSADVWSKRRFFTIDDEGNGDVVAGVPPDAFTAEGQRWGNPLYNWDVLKADKFTWWIDRLRTHFSIYDLVRIDHFRGLESYWEIPASSPTAMDGHWVKAPGADLLSRVQEKFSEMSLVAEDLGIITSAVDDLRRQFSLPGMKVLQFAFDGDSGNHHLPHNHSADMIVYTGTHDNDTTLSWYQLADDATRDRVRRYLECSDNDMPWPLIRSAMMSSAQTAIFPMQDLLSLGTGHRMNTPGTVEGNWNWRFDWHQVESALAARMQELTARYSRLSDGQPIQSFQAESSWHTLDQRKA